MPTGGNVDGKFSVGYRDAVVRTVVNLDRETTASYTLVLEAIGRHQPTHGVHVGWPSRSQAMSLRLCPDATGEGATRPSVYYGALVGREARHMALHAGAAWEPYGRAACRQTAAKPGGQSRRGRRDGPRVASTKGGGNMRRGVIKAGFLEEVASTSAFELIRTLGGKF